jgi:MFS family permease
VTASAQAPERTDGSAHPVRVLLEQRDFRRLLSIRLAGQFADGLFQAALVSAVFFDPNRATTATQAAVGFATLLLPFSLVGPFAGVFLDRWRRQRVLLLSNLLRAGLLVVLAPLLAAFGPTSPAVVALTLVVISLNRFVLSGLSASLPQVVPGRRLVTANSFTTTLGGGAVAFGGASAAGLRSLVGTGDVGASRSALLASALYVVAALIARTVGANRLGPTEPPVERHLSAALRAVLGGLVSGARHVHERGPAARGLAAITAHRFFYGLSFVATLLLYARTGFLGRGFAHSGGGAFLALGEVVFASVMGGLLAALVTPRVTRRVGTQAWISVVFAVAAVVEVVFGAPYTHRAFLVAALVLGFAAQAAKICVDTLVQESVEDDFRGRVFSFYDTLFNVSFVSAAAAAAFLVPSNGRSYLLIAVVAGGYALTSLIYLLASRRAAPVLAET